MSRRILAIVGLLTGTTLLHAQATPTASRRGDAQVGAGYSNASSDYGPRFRGWNIYGDFDFTQHFGVEAEFHSIQPKSPTTLYERTYEVGGRYFRTYGRLLPYGKVLIGRGVFNYPPCSSSTKNVACANLAYNMFAIGGGADFRVREWLTVRGDYEYQNWPSFRGTIGGASNGLTPSIISVGAAYHFR